MPSASGSATPSRRRCPSPRRRPAPHVARQAGVPGRVGRVERCDGGFVFPDTNAHGAGEQPQHLYHVRFAVRELWGPDAETGASVGLDLFESYLESAPQEERPHG